MILKRYDAVKFRKANPELYQQILNNYAPVFDRWVAISCYMADIPPLRCTVCGERMQVSIKNFKNPVHKQCQYEKYRVTYELAKTKIPDLITEWEGKASKNLRIQRYCPDHGVWSQVLSSALSGTGCQKCYLESKIGKPKYDVSHWIEKFKLAHGNRYGYYDYDDIFSDKPITINCSIHGDFDQAPNLHASGHGCTACAIAAQIDTQRMTLEEFIDRCKQKHGDYYDYSKTVFRGLAYSPDNKVTIICPKHGDFIQRPNDHLNAKFGCPKCAYENMQTVGVSKYEIEIRDHIHALGLVTVGSYRELGFEIDVFVPDRMVGIEFNGTFWHCESNGRDSKYHINKTVLAKEKGIDLIHIWEHHWHSDRENCLLSIAERLMAQPLNSEINYVMVVTSDKITVNAIDKNDTVKQAQFSFSEGNWWLSMSPAKYHINNFLFEAIKLFKTVRDGAIMYRQDVSIHTDVHLVAAGFRILETISPQPWFTDDYINVSEFPASEGTDCFWDCGAKIWVRE